MPALGTFEHFKKHGKNKLNTALVPADIDVWLSALETYGTLSFEKVALPTAEMVERGYPLYKMQQYMILANDDSIRKFPYNAQFFLQAEPHGYRIGSLMKNADLGKTIRYMIDAEKKALAAGKNRKEAIRAARDAFYTGEPARAIDKMFRELGWPDALRGPGEVSGQVDAAAPHASTGATTSTRPADGRKGRA